jgi:hypothetical protein
MLLRMLNYRRDVVGFEADIIQSYSSVPMFIPCHVKAAPEATPKHNGDRRPKAYARKRGFTRRGQAPAPAHDARVVRWDLMSVGAEKNSGMMRSCRTP